MVPWDLNIVKNVWATLFTFNGFLGQGFLFIRNKIRILLYWVFLFCLTFGFLIFLKRIFDIYIDIFVDDIKVYIYIYLNSYCNIYFLCFLDIKINMYTWWLREAENFALYTIVFHLSLLVIKRFTNWGLWWNLTAQFIWYILNAPPRLRTIYITLHIMERLNVNYSKKNIPTASIYKLMLTSKVVEVIKGMRWEFLGFLGKLDSSSNRDQIYGFESPPSWRNGSVWEWSIGID